MDRISVKHMPHCRRASPTHAGSMKLRHLKYLYEVVNFPAPVRNKERDQISIYFSHDCKCRSYKFLFANLLSNNPTNLGLSELLRPCEPPQ